MTVVVGIYCHDGVVIATYSMLTASLGTTAVGHHHAKKLYLIQGSQIVSCSGDPGLAARFRFVANNCHKDIEQMQPLEYGIKLSQEICVQFQSTGLNLAEVDLGVIIAFPHVSGAQCCVFENNVQPRILDEHHHYVALGVGKMSADPFLRFLDDIFISDWSKLTLNEALLLSIWTVDHVIKTNPGGVAGPIQLATLSIDNGSAVSKEYEQNEIQERMASIGSAEDALRAWRDVVSGATTPGNAIPPTP